MARILLVTGDDTACDASGDTGDDPGGDTPGAPRSGTGHGLRRHLTTAGLDVELIERRRPTDVTMVVDAFDVVLVDARSVDHELEIVRAVHRSGHLVPIVLVWADGPDEYRARGLDAGADSVFTGPVSPLVIIAQVRAHARRSAWWWRPTEEPPGGTSGLRYDVRGRSLVTDDRRVLLTPRENALLHALARRQGRYVSTDNLLRLVWGPDVRNAHVVASCVRQVRSRLAELGSAHLVESRRGYGYRLSGQAVVLPGSRLPAPRADGPDAG